MKCAARIAVLGNSGSGKTTLARAMASASNAALLDLDTIYWERAAIAVSRPPQAARDDLAAFCAANPRWVIEGCYGDLVGSVLHREPHLILLHPGKEACLDNCRARPWEPSKYASKAEQDAYLENLLGWVAAYYDLDGPLSLKGHLALYEAYAGPKQLLTSLPELSSLPSHEP
jgi:adenylate kinase family enzyme